MARLRSAATARASGNQTLARSTWWRIELTSLGHVGDRRRGLLVAVLEERDGRSGHELVQRGASSDRLRDVGVVAQHLEDGGQARHLGADPH